MKSSPAVGETVDSAQDQLQNSTEDKVGGRAGAFQSTVAEQTRCQWRQKEREHRGLSRPDALFFFSREDQVREKSFQAVPTAPILYLPFSDGP